MTEPDCIAVMTTDPETVSALAGASIVTLPVVDNVMPAAVIVLEFVSENVIGVTRTAIDTLCDIAPEFPVIVTV